METNDKELDNWIKCLKTSKQLDETVQTLEYMLAHNSYNFAQIIAMNIALDTLRIIRDSRCD